MFKVKPSLTFSKWISPKGVFLALLLSFGSVIFVLALIEGTLRIFPGLLPEGARLRIHWQWRPPWSVPHPYIGHLHNPKPSPYIRDSSVVNLRDALGFRNAQPWPDHAEIIAVGDSVTFSQTVDDEKAWTAILDRSLRYSRVLNFGLIGGAPQQYLRVYETYGIDFAPKVLLIGLFLGNDLWGAGQFDRWWKSGGKGDFLYFGRPEARPGVWEWFIRKLKSSYIIAVLREIRDIYRSGRFLKGKTMELADGGRIQIVPSELFKWAKVGQPGSRAFTLVLETLERIQAIAKQHKTHILVLFFPSKEEVYLPLFGEELVDLAAPFISELDKLEITYIDLGPHFRRRAAAQETLFWEVDGHPNERGYALIAEVVLAHLKRNAQRYGLKDGEVEPSQAGS